jgi:SulP family sulfate permease
MLGKQPFISAIGKDAIFHTKRDAIHEVFERLDRAICATCTRRIFEECRSLPPPVAAEPGH